MWNELSKTAKIIIVVIFLEVAIVISIVFCNKINENINVNTTTKKSECQNGNTTFSVSKYNVEDGKFYFYGKFKNNDKDGKIFDFCYTITAYQDGIALDDDFWIDDDYQANSSREIQTGTTITVCKDFTLRNKYSDITVVVKSAFTNKKLLEKTYVINKRVE